MTCHRTNLITKLPKFDVKIGFENPTQSFIFSGKLNDYLRSICELPAKSCRVWQGEATLRVNSWELDLGEATFLIWKTPNAN